MGPSSRYNLSVYMAVWNRYWMVSSCPQYSYLLIPATSSSRFLYIFVPSFQLQLLGIAIVMVCNGVCETRFDMQMTGLPSHPQHELALRQCYGHSGMVTFVLHGDLDRCNRFLGALKIICPATSLGGYESVIFLL